MHYNGYPSTFKSYGTNMIRVKVDIVPYGNEDEARQVAQMIIANDGTGDNNIANYGFVYSDNSDFGEGAVFDFSRSTGIWELIYKCLGSGDTHSDDEFMDLLLKRMK